MRHRTETEIISTTDLETLKKVDPKIFCLLEPLFASEQRLKSFQLEPIPINIQYEPKLDTVEK